MAVTSPVSVCQGHKLALLRGLLNAMLTLEPELEDLFWPKCTCEAPYTAKSRRNRFTAWSDVYI